MEVKQIKSKFLRNIFDQNTYAVIGKNSALIIDAGAEIEDIKAAVSGKKVLAVLMTHLHFDHLWNIEYYTRQFDCDVYIQGGAEEKLSDSNKNASYFVKKNMVFNIPKNHIKNYAEKFKLDEFEIEIFKTPGHSSDSVCIKIGDYLFTGDTVFSDSIGRTDFYDSSPDAMEASLKLIESIDFKIACPGHYDECTKSEAVNVIKMFI